jgi:putative ABC transport system substrate-binding protein
MRKNLLTTVAASLILAFVHLADAQQPAKVRTIGSLGISPASGSGSGSEVIRRELHALGWVEGKNIAIEYRSADNKLDRLPALADELVRLKVDVILTPSPPAALAARGESRARGGRIWW